MIKKLLASIVLALFLVTACANVSYEEFKEGAYSMQFVNWGDREPDNVNIAMKQGNAYCDVLVSRRELGSLGFELGSDVALAFIKNLPGATILKESKNPNEVRLEVKASFNGKPIKSEIKAIPCDGKTYAVAYTCKEPKFSKFEHVKTTMFNSMKCS
ncbi:MAG: hypothetical protein AABW49_02385 [Nanoarchaeota archaeon]